MKRVHHGHVSRYMNSKESKRLGRVREAQTEFQKLQTELQIKIQIEIQTENAKRILVENQKQVNQGFKLDVMTGGWG